MIFTLKWLYPYWKNHKPRVLLIIIFGMAGAALHIATPILIKNIINGLSANANYAYIRMNVLLILAVGFAIYFINLIAMRSRAWMNIRLEWEFRQNVFEHIIGLDQSFYHKYTTGDLVTRLMDDISKKISWFACSGVFRFLQSGFTLVAVISAMFYFNLFLALWILLPLPFMFAFSVIVGRMLTKQYNLLQNTISSIYDFLETVFTGVKVIKANSKEKAQCDYFSIKADEQKEAEIHTGRLDIIFSYFYYYAGFLCIVILYAVGGGQVIDGKITLGELIAFQFYAAMLVFPLMDISQFFVAGNRAGVSIRRVNELLKQKSKIRFSHKPEFLNEKIYKIKFKNISFSAPPDNSYLLKDINFSADKGQRIAIVGKIGCGKTSLLKLILRLEEYSDGTIDINEKDIRKIDIKALRGKISFVSQEAYIFSDTILNNIIMGRKDISKDAIEKAIEVSQLKQDMHKFPKGLNTFVGTRGLSISGGQKQRLSLARALSINPEVLVLDDATGAMDALTEENFWQIFKEEFPETICLLATHRIKTIEKSDHIITLSSGKIAEQGKHKDLMADGGLYKEIYEREKLKEEMRDTKP
ncbi:MAG: ABC transporter ATP-binding protein/permease [Elusimicrobia bacterium]|nr:ABC transporter ATP-binding protein/permease [Elusimicrobiota bacterium]